MGNPTFYVNVIQLLQTPWSTPYKYGFDYNTDSFSPQGVATIDTYSFRKYNDEIGEVIGYGRDGSIWFKKLSLGTWSSWQRIDNYGTSSLSELASALGVIDRFAPYKYIVSTTNANNITDISFWYGTEASTTNNFPENGKGALVSFINASQGFQLFVSVTYNKVYFRTIYASFSGWVLLTNAS